MNLFLEEQDSYQVKKTSLIADYDYKTLIMLYQPIIGAKALSLYFTLLFDSSFQEWFNINSHLELSKKTELNLLEIYNARKKLEAIGLLKTLRKVEDNCVLYIYELKAPKTPDSFFNDPLFYGLLESVISKKHLSRLKHFFKFQNNKYDDNFLDISADFNSVYSDLSLKLNVNNEMFYARKESIIKNEFNEKKFAKLLSDKYAISSKNIHEDFLNQISRIALLFNYDEEAMALFSSNFYHPHEENPFDLDEIYDACKKALIIPLNNEKSSGYKVYEQDDLLAKKINLLNDTSPIEYFRLKSHNTYPSPSDINIINILSKDYNLSNGVINVIIDQTLDACNQDFPKAYCEKIAAKLKRLDVKNALEAINALKKRKTKTKKEVKDDLSIQEDDIDLEALKKEGENL